MPLKVRELKQLLRQAGYIEVRGGGKGSHSKWNHPRHPDLFVHLSGKDGSDAARYHEAKVRDCIRTIIQRELGGRP